MNVLGIETSGDWGSVGLTSDEAVIGEFNFAARMKHGERLFLAIKHLLSICEINKRDIDLIAVATGPGSFTGLRIGVSSAKGMAQALGIPVVGIRSADGYRRRWYRMSDHVAVISPDRQEWLYITEYLDRENSTGTRVESVGEFLERAGKARENNEQIVYMGPGVELHRELLEEKRLSLASESLNRPSGSEIAQLGAIKFAETGANELQELEPFYLQPPMTTPAKNK